MQSLSYPARLSSEENGAFTVTFADLPEAITSGVNLEDAREQAAIAGCIVRKLYLAMRGRRISNGELPRSPLALKT